MLIYAKLIANMLNPKLSSLTHPDQVGFVQGRKAHDNTLKTLDIIQYAHSYQIPLMILSLDAKKSL